MLGSLEVRTPNLHQKRLRQCAIIAHGAEIDEKRQALHKLLQIVCKSKSRGRWASPSTRWTESARESSKSFVKRGC